jgi:hypothetical protein
LNPPQRTPRIDLAPEPVLKVTLHEKNPSQDRAASPGYGLSASFIVPSLVRNTRKAKQVERNAVRRLYRLAQTRNLLDV